MTTSTLDRTTRGRHWSDWVGLAAYLLLAGNVMVHSRELGLLILPTILHEVLTAITFLLRPRARRVLPGLWPRVITYGHAFLIAAFLAVATTWYPEWVASVESRGLRIGGGLVWLAGTLVGLWPLWYLRRSFSLEPEARALVIAGPYKLARHPIYASYALTFAGMWMRSLTLPFTLILVAWFALMLLRIRNEEAVLAATFPEYAAYRERVAAFGPRLARASQVRAP